MSTEMKPTKAFSLTRFSGGKKGVCLQITTQEYEPGTHVYQFIRMTRVEAAELAISLMQFAADILPEKELD